MSKLTMCGTGAICVKHFYRILKDGSCSETEVSEQL
jgi:hypothetical protein